MSNAKKLILDSIGTDSPPKETEKSTKTSQSQTQLQPKKTEDKLPDQALEKSLIDGMDDIDSDEEDVVKKPEPEPKTKTKSAIPKKTIDTKKEVKKQNIQKLVTQIIQEEKKVLEEKKEVKANEKKSEETKDVEASNSSNNAVPHEKKVEHKKEKEVKTEDPEKKVKNEDSEKQRLDPSGEINVKKKNSVADNSEKDPNAKTDEPNKPTPKPKKVYKEFEIEDKLFLMLCSPTEMRTMEEASTKKKLKMSDIGFVLISIKDSDEIWVKPVYIRASKFRRKRYVLASKNVVTNYLKKFNDISATLVLTKDNKKMKIVLEIDEDHVLYTTKDTFLAENEDYYLKNAEVHSTSFESYNKDIIELRNQAYSKEQERKKERRAKEMKSSPKRDKETEETNDEPRQKKIKYADLYEWMAEGYRLIGEINK